MSTEQLPAPEIAATISHLRKEADSRRRWAAVGLAAFALNVGNVVQDIVEYGEVLGGGKLAGIAGVAFLGAGVSNSIKSMQYSHRADSLETAQIINDNTTMRQTSVFDYQQQ